MKTIHVRPAREGELVPFSPNRPGQYIGMRPRRKDESVAVAASAGTHEEPSRVKRGASVVGTEYVAQERPFTTVEDSLFYRRAIIRKDLVEVSQAEVDAYLKAEAEKAAKAANPVDATPAAEAAVEEPKADEQPAADTGARRAKGGAR